MEKLEMKVVVTLPVGWVVEGEALRAPTEKVLWSTDLASFNPDIIDDLVPGALRAAQDVLGVATLGQMKAVAPEVVVALSAEEEDNCRPALHLTTQTMALMAEAGADFDFDPYCE